MKKLIVVAVGMVMAVGVFAETWTDPKTGLSWTYQIVGDSVSVGGGGYSSPALPTSTSGAIDIPPEINGTNVTMIGAYAFSFCNKLTSVTIPSCVTSIGEWSFAACSGMTNVSMSGGVTDIGFFAFGSCDGLTCITIPASVLHIGNEVFEGCGELVSIDVDGDNPNYKSENGLLLTKDGKTLFQGVNGVVTVPAGVMDINNYAFASLDGLTRIMIPSSVTNVGYGCFSGCSGLTEIIVEENNPNYKTENGLILSKNGQDLIHGVNGIVTVPEACMSIATEAFRGRSGLKNVSMPNSVTNIGNSAFAWTGLTSMSVGQGVVNIGICAFGECYDMTSVTIPSSVANVGASAFGGCVNLGVVKFEGAPPSGLSSASIRQGAEIRYNVAYEKEWLPVIEECGFTNATAYDPFPDGGPYTCGVDGVVWTFTVQNGEATIGDGTKSSISTNTSGVIIVPSLLGGRKVTSIGRYAFLNCIELTKVAIPSNVTSISEFAFYGCAALESVIIPASVTDIGFYAFDGCNGICDVTVPGWKCRIDFTSVTNLVISSGITSIENGAFQRCAALTNVTIPGSVTSIGAYAFYCCYGLTSLTIPTSVTSLGYGAFMHCEALCNVSIPSGVTSIEDGVFYGCNEIRDAVLPGWLCGIDSDVITNVVISEGTTDIKDFGFYVCDNLRCITISPSVTNIGRYAFHCCKDLKGVIIPSSVINISEEAFSRNNALTEMNIPSSVKNIGDRAFQLCGNLNRLMICEGVERIGTFAFDECAGLTTVVIPASVTNVGFGAFNGCDGIRDVTVPGWKCRIDFTSVTNLVISNGATSIDAFAFNGSKNLMSVTIPIGVTYIGDSAFRECSSLSKVVLPSGVEVIGDHAFGDCAVLSSMSIPSTVTTIRSSAFDGCSGLMALLLPSSLAYIGENAFVNCHSLNSIDFEGTPPEGVKDAQIKADAAIRYNVNYEDAWLPIIEECKWTNATSYEPVPRPVMFAAVNGEVSIGSYFYTNVAVYGVLPEARRDGCTFAGWYTSLDGTNRVNAFSAVDPRVKTLYARWVEDDVALYAQWGANRYSVSFNANGGEGDMEAQPFLYDQVQGLTGARFTKTGYSFKGWSTSADGEVVYKDGESVSNLTVEAGFAVALFAKWEKVIDVLPEEVEEWVGYTLAPKFKKAGETNSQYRKRFEATYGDDYSAAFFKETGKIGHDGMRLQVWHDYVAGTDPLDEKSMFTATITLVDGVPRVSYLPELTEEQMSLRTYTTLGKKHLQDAAWTDITNAGDEERKLYNFFKVTVEMK